MVKNIKIIGLLVAIFSMASAHGQISDDEFVKFLENKEIKGYSKAGRALTDYYMKIGLVDTVENKEDGNFDCAKVPSYKKEIEKLKNKIKNKKIVADAFVEVVEEDGDKRKKDYYARLNSSFDVIINQYDLSIAGYISNNCE